MEAGLYAFRPASQQAGLELIRFRAATAKADIQLASGAWSVEDAVSFLTAQSMLSRAQAAAEVSFMVAHPGEAASAFGAYGQVVRFLADAATLQGEDFSLTDFNERLLGNALVPLALQRWEYLGLEDELDQLVEQRGRPATVPE
jgi:uncharacterized protein (DUF885 family)